MEEIERVNENPEFREYMSAEEDNRKIENSIRSEGYELGVKQGLEKGLEKGLKEGIEQGKKEGIEQGKKEGIEEIVKEMMKQNYSKEEIKNITGIDIDEE